MKRGSPADPRRSPALLLVVLVAFSFQGSRGLYESTEGRYAECAREMIASGNYLEPTLGGDPHWTKPPLTYWAIAAGVEMCGRNAWGARLANAIALVVTTLLVAGVARALFDEKTGLLAALVYGTSGFPVAAANAVSTDTLLTMFEVAAVFCFLRARRGGGTWVVGMWLAFGFGFLTKGPPALLPLVPISIWHRRRTPRIRLVSLTGLGLFLVVGVGWYALVAAWHDGLLSRFVGAEVVDRIFTDRFGRSPEWYQPLLRYLPVLLLGGLAWTWPLVSLVRSERLLHPSVIRRRLGESGAGSFLLLWFTIPLVVFCLARSRMVLYVLPLFAPVAIAVARGLALRTSAGSVRWLAVVSALLLISGKGILSVKDSKRDMGAVHRACRELDASAPVLVLDESPLHGLEFYDGGQVPVVSSDPDGPHPSPLRLLRAELASGWRRGPVLLVVRDRKRRRLDRVFAGSGMVRDQRSIAHWDVLKVGPPRD